MPSSTIGAIILAAGRSSRMGTHKLLLPLGGRPVIAHVVEAALGAPLQPVVVVLGHNADQVRGALPVGELLVVENLEFATGLASSLRTGLRALPSAATGALVLLGDQPLLTASHLTTLLWVATQTAAPVVAACYQGRRSNPVYFSRACFPELQQLAGDEGGRAVVQRYAARLQLVTIDDTAAGLDVDEPADYQRVSQLWFQRHG